MDQNDNNMPPLVAALLGMAGGNAGECGCETCTRRRQIMLDADEIMQQSGSLLVADMGYSCLAEAMNELKYVNSDAKYSVGFFGAIRLLLATACLRDPALLVPTIALLKAGTQSALLRTSLKGESIAHLMTHDKEADAPPSQRAA